MLGNKYTTIDTGIKRSSGWLSPDGTFYQCGPADHLEAAHYLTTKLFDVPYGDHILLSKGWWKIYIGGYARSDTEGRMTQKQLDTLWDLHNCDDKTIESMELWREGLWPFIKEAEIW